MTPIENCKVCNGSNFKELLKLKDYFLSQEEFSIYYCENCGFKFTHPIPDAADLGKYYKSDKYVSHSDTKKGLFFNLYHLVKKQALRKKYKLITNFATKGNILDYGCGTGDFLSAFKTNDWNCFGIEPDDDTRQYATDKQGLKITVPENINNFEKNSFDVISLWHVLEHITDLNEKLNSFKALLKSKGILVIAVPNADSFDAGYYQKYWAAYDVPRHLYHFNNKTLSLLLEKHGFEIIKKEKMLFDSFYVSMLSEQYKKNSFGFIKGIFIGLISNLKSSSKNYNASSFILIARPKNDL